MRNWKLCLAKVLSRIAVPLCCCVLWGCAGLADLDGTATKWHQYVTPRPPRSPVEEGVVKVAETRKNMSLSGSDILFITSDLSNKTPVQCIDVVSNPNTGKPDSRDRSVVRYRVIGGNISAMRDASTEYYLDANLERAILRAVAKTWSPDPVIIYNDGPHAMTISSHAINNCTADVKIFEGDSMSNPVASKEVSFCFAR